MNILDLPPELVIHVMLQLDPSDVVACGQVSSYFKCLLDTTVIRYKFALAAAGMVDGPASGVPVQDRLLALERYTQAWRTAKLIQDPELPIDRDQHYRYPAFTGGAIPIVHGSQLSLIVPASPARRLPSQVWSMDLGDIPSEPLRCSTDLSQSLLVLCYLKPHPTRTLECQTYSLSAGTTVSPHAEAAIPTINVDAGAAHEPFVVQMDIYHDLLVWSWYADTHVHLRVYNWKSGIVVWESTDRIRIQFAFLDRHHIVVASHNAHNLRVYAIDPDRPTSTMHYGVGRADDASVHVFLLPLVKAGGFTQIQQLSSQQTHPSRPGCAVPFEHDTRLTILAISLYIGSSDSGQSHTLCVPTSALLAHVCNPNDPDAEQDRGAVPWEAWGAPCSRLFPIVAGGRWWDVRVMGSRCLFFAYREGRPIALDILVADFRPWAKYDASDDCAELLAEYMDTSDVIAAHENLVVPIYNRLPFRAVCTAVVYGEDFDFNWINSLVALLPDGVVVTNNSDRESTQSLLHLFTA